MPALIVPWGFDQFFTAAQLMRVGAGQWMSRRSYTPDRAASALRVLLQQDSSYRQRARAIAARIAQEDGVGTLSAAIEDVLRANQVPARAHRMRAETR